MTESTTLSPFQHYAIGPAHDLQKVCAGYILHAPQGNNGFGDDPIFLYPPLSQSFAEIPAVKKNRISHRGHALAEVAAEATKIANWLKHRLMEAKPPKPDHEEFENNDWSAAH